MNKRTYLPGFGIMLLSFILWACEGPAGAMGPQGVQGEQGQQGDQGPEGTANVIYSEWTTFVSGTWTAPFSFFGQNRRSYTVNEPQITQDIIDTGTVAVYVRFGGSFNNIQPLPIIQSITQTKNQVLDYHFRLGEIVIVFYNLDDTDDPGAIGSGNQYRYIIIPGGTPAKIKSLDLNDYDAVVKYFGINA